MKKMKKKQFDVILPSSFLKYKTITHLRINSREIQRASFKILYNSERNNLCFYHQNHSYCLFHSSQTHFLAGLGKLYMSSTYKSFLRENNIGKSKENGAEFLFISGGYFPGIVMHGKLRLR